MRATLLGMRHRKNQDPIEALRAARQQYGMARLHMGVLLEHLRTHKGWEGEAESFAGLLEELRINQTAAYQYMRVAKRFFFELPLPDGALTQMCMANISTLELAGRVANEENLAEVVSVVTSLSERDAKTTLEEMLQAQESENTAPRREPRLAKVLRLYRELPDDQRIDVRNALRIQNA